MALDEGTVRAPSGPSHRATSLLRAEPPALGQGLAGRSRQLSGRPRPRGPNRSIWVRKIFRPNSTAFLPDGAQSIGLQNSQGIISIIYRMHALS